eukprot:53746-Eustigmatos_ZCMA.PRE.1
MLRSVGACVAGQQCGMRARSYARAQAASRPFARNAAGRWWDGGDVGPDKSERRRRGPGTSA